MNYMDIKENKSEKPLVIFKVGKHEFLTEEAAERFVEKAKKAMGLKYFKVTYSPDLTEGRGYYREALITTNEVLGVNIVYEYLNKTLGIPIAWVMGVSPMPNYSVREINITSYEDIERLLNEKYTSIGSSVQKERPHISLESVESPEDLKLIVSLTKEKL